MSFQSGFNSGLNHFASMRADASRQRELEFAQGQATIDNARTARLDDDNLKSAEVDRRIGEERIKQIQQEMRNEKRMQARLAANFETANVALGVFAKETQDLDPFSPESQAKWIKAYKETAPYVSRDPQAWKSFEAITSVQKQFIGNELYNMEQNEMIKNLFDRSQARKEMAETLGIGVNNISTEQLDSYTGFKKVKEKALKANIWIEDALDGAGLTGKDVTSLTNGDLVSLNDWVDKEGARLGRITPAIMAEQDAVKSIREAIQRGDWQAAFEANGMHPAEIGETMTNNMQQLEGVFTQIRDLSRAIDSLDVKTGPWTGPIKAEFNRAIGNDEMIAAFNTATSQVVPGLARGVFQEVGVLTDGDFARYANGLASLSNTENANEIVSAYTQAFVADTIIRTIESTIERGRLPIKYLDLLGKAKATPRAFYKAAEGMDTDTSVIQQVAEDIQFGRFSVGDMYAYWDDRAKQNVKQVITPEIYAKLGGR